MDEKMCLFPAAVFSAREGAAVVDGGWHHFTAGDFTIEEMAYAPDNHIPIRMIGAGSIF
jgi:hypothetical protein